MPFLTLVRYFQPRQSFALTDKEKIKWFPAHMYRGIIKMQQKLKTVDCIVEVHDARIPISGRNPNFKHEFFGIKPHVLVLNKKDLSDTKYETDVKDYLKTREKIEHVVYTNCKKYKEEGVLEVIPVVKDVIMKAERYNRAFNREFGVLIVGVPNVGKSSLINSLRAAILKKGGVALVGDRAGVTKAVQNRIKISFNPPVFVYDTPGIMVPRIGDIEIGMKLALCGTFQDHMVGYMIMADYLLYWMNKNHNHKYMDYFQIDKPCDDINILLLKDAIRRNVYVKRIIGGSIKSCPNIDLAAMIFVKSFRHGMFGGVLLDTDKLP